MGNNKKLNRLLYLVFVITFSSITMVSVLYARPYGRTGRSGKQGGTACAACHFGPDTPDLSFEIDDNVMPGETINVSFTVRRTSSNPNVTTAGFNVAVDAGDISGRNESPEACTDLDEPDHSNITCISEFSGLNEIAHARPTVLQDGEFTYEFSWTAPITPGNYTIYGAGVTAVSGAGAFNTDIHGGYISTTLTVGNDTAPQAPVAAFEFTPNDLKVTFDATTSSDPDGSVVSYNWNFGDGTAATGAQVDHTYATAGSYTVNLTIEDNDGLSDNIDQTVTVEQNSNPEAPNATYSFSQSGVRTVTFDASGSTDNGEIVSYIWAFGDGEFGVGEVISHTYETAGTYTVLLDIRDDEGLRGSITRFVTVTNDPSEEPFQANFTSAQSGHLTMSFDGSSSTSERPIQSYIWAFGDGGFGNGQTINHTYAISGTYTVLLTIVDVDGERSTSEQNVVVSPNPPQTTTLIYLPIIRLDE